MLHRQRILLYLLKLAGGSATKLQVTKWAFLLANESTSKGGDSFYEFLPYKFGPYSFCIYQEATAMIGHGLLTASDDKTWSLTESGLCTANATPDEFKTDAAQIHRRYGLLDNRRLLDEVYTRYPWFSVNSEVRRLAQRTKAPPAIYTAGYEGLTIDGFLNRLMEAGIERVIDVRSNPVSRRYGYHKSTLARLCGDVGIDYSHFPELGIASEERQELLVLDDRAALFANYESQILPNQKPSIHEVARLMKERASVLVCMEADPADCHRSRLAAAVSLLLDLPLRDLGACACHGRIPVH
jgi:hypothetical protein